MTRVINTLTNTKHDTGFVTPEATQAGEPDVYKWLSGSNAQMHNSVSLGDVLEFTHWSNDDGRISYSRPQHHTLSCYLEGGFQMHRLQRSGSLTGGAPGKICLMPAEHESSWHVKDHVNFIHFYFSDQDLVEVSEKVWDKSPGQIHLDDRTFKDDAYLASLFSQTIASLNWQDNGDMLALQNISQILMVHMLKHYCADRLQSPGSSGGLTGYQLRRIREYIDAHLGSDMSLKHLAEQLDLSEYHFARMFKKASGQTVHQFVTRERIERSKALIRKGNTSLADIALQTGFSSQAHFSNRFRQLEQITPVRYRKSILP